ncbi:MAG: DUF3127 domain-containing protein [Thiohalocapsa sp.]
MELTGRIVQILPEKSGTSARGEWRKQEYIIEIAGDYPKQVCFMVWGDRIDQFGIQQGQELSVSINLESREYNGRWYTDVKAWRVAPAGETGASDVAESPPPFDDELPPF